MPRSVERIIHLAIAIGLLNGAAAVAQARPPVAIYLHGRIIEEQGPRAISPVFGPYAFHAIVDSLRAGGVSVIADLRPSGADPTQWAGRVVAQVDSLTKAGVDPANVTVVGFSKGGGIAILAAARLARPEVGFVFLGSCGDGSGEFPAVSGRILSIFEQSDSLGQSCRGLLRRAGAGSITEERSLATGLGHGAFYQPRSDWLSLVRAWIRQRRLPPAG